VIEEEKTEEILNLKKEQKFLL